VSDELQLSPEVTAAIRADLGKGRQGLEDTASAAPGSVDAGDMSAMLSSMLGRITEQAAQASAACGAIGDQVGVAGAAFWELDAEVASVFSGPGGPPRAD
jgi:hypothetical protein